MEKKNKKLIQAVVCGNKRYHEGTLVVRVKRAFKDPKVGKIVEASKKYIVEYPSKSPILNGTIVFISKCAPVSKRKHYIISEVQNVA